MEDVTDIGFRMLCKRFGAQMVYTEFVSAEALVRSIKSTVSKLTVCDEERPVGIQIYGRDAEAMVEAAKIVEDQAHPDVIDINFGCPVKKVASKGAGAGMLQNIPKLLDITRQVVKAVKTPVTVKTRLGWTYDQIVMGNNPTDPYLVNTPFEPTAAMSQQSGAPVSAAAHQEFSTAGAPVFAASPAESLAHTNQVIDLAERLQDCGIQALTIHGRTRSQMYTGDADWSYIAQVKANPRIHIPIIGNGDICSLQQADQAFDQYGVDAVMVGRATFGCPWFFSREELTLDQKIDTLLEQLHINVERLDEYRGILHTRRHLAATPIFKGIPDFRQTRIAMLRAETVSELTAIIEQVRERLHSEAAAVK